MEHKELGKIVKIMDLQTFDSGFIKLEFVIETETDYPQQIKFEVTKEKAENFTKFNKLNDRVMVSFNVNGNYYEPLDKYFVNLQAWHIQNMDSNEADGNNSNGEMQTQGGALVEGEDDLPF